MFELASTKMPPSEQRIRIHGLKHTIAEFESSEEIYRASNEKWLHLFAHVLKKDADAALIFFDAPQKPSFI